jgi:hypothetical protein
MYKKGSDYVHRIGLYCLWSYRFSVLFSVRQIIPTRSIYKQNTGEARKDAIIQMLSKVTELKPGNL